MPEVEGIKGVGLAKEYKQIAVDEEGHGQVDVVSMPPMTVEIAEKGFSDATDTPTRALVDSDRHVQVDVLTTANPPNLDVALSTRASESTLSSIDGKITKCDTDNVTLSGPLSTAGNLNININEDTVGLAKDSTVSSIDSKITKCDTDNVTLVGPLSATGNLNVNINEDSVGIATESTLSSINGKITKCDTDNVTLAGPLSAAGNLNININEDSVGLATESTLSGIKGQTDKLTFDASSYLYVNAAAVSNPSNLDVALSTRASETTLSSIDSKLTNVNASLIDADETVAQSITLNNAHRSVLEVYASATTATNFYLDVSLDGSTWYNYTSWSSVTSVAEGFFIGFPYVRLRSDAAGASGDTVTLILTANP